MSGEKFLENSTLSINIVFCITTNFAVFFQNGRRVFASTVDRRGRLLGVPRLGEQLLGCDERAASYFPSVFFLSSNGRIEVSVFDELFIKAACRFRPL